MVLMISFCASVSMAISEYIKNDTNSDMNVVIDYGSGFTSCTGVNTLIKAGSDWSKTFGCCPKSIVVTGAPNSPLAQKTATYNHPSSVKADTFLGMPTLLGKTVCESVSVSIVPNANNDGILINPKKRSWSSYLGL